MLRLAGITKRYGGDPAPALHALDLEAARGELIALVGPSGAGKSTALRIIAGLEPPTEGRVWIDGRDVTGEPTARRGVALVDGAVMPHLTVFENLAFPLRVRRIAPAAIAMRVAAAARAVGVTELLERWPKHLSGGQRQRVAIARAVVQGPRVFLFDEPLSNLDAAARAELRLALRRAHEDSGATSLYVTHDATEAAALADRVVALSPT